MYQIIMWYTLNIYNVACQLYLNKVGDGGTTMRYHLTPIRIVIIKKPRDNKCLRGCGEKETLVYSWWECKLVQPLGKQYGRYSKN